MKIGVDLDDVLIDYMGGFCNFYNRKYGTNFSIEDFKSHNIWETIGGSKLRAVLLVNFFYYSKLFDEIKLMDGAREAIKKLSEDNDLPIVTARFKHFRKKTKRFIKKIFDGGIEKVFYTGFYNPTGKLDLCKKEGIDLLIEDNPHYAMSCADEGINVFLFDRPWNRDFNEQEYENITRVKTWNEILERLGERKEIK